MPNKKIVIIDDEQSMAELLKLELGAEGFNVMLAKDGKEGLQLIRQVMPNMVILDIMMPHMDGHEVLKNLKNDNQTRDIPVIILTAKGMEADVQKGLDTGADDYITKPFHAGLLLKRIESVLKNSNNHNGS